MSGFSTGAVLLRRVEYGDHDYIISFLTRTNGRVSVIARNAKKSVKRFPGALDLFSRYRILCTYPKKRKDSLTILSSAELENGFVRIRQSLFKTAYASFWAEVIHFWLEEEKPLPELYQLLLFSLSSLDQGLIPDAVASLMFQIRFMGLSGFAPDFEVCRLCGSVMDDMGSNRVWFDFREGHLICSECERKRSRQGMTVSKGTLKQLYWISRSDPDRADRIKFSAYTLKEGEQLMESFVCFHMGRDYRSLRFLNQVRPEREIKRKGDHEF